MNPALSQEFHFFCEQEQLQKHATLNKNIYYVYGTLKCFDRPRIIGALLQRGSLNCCSLIIGVSQNKVSIKSGLNTICRLNPLVIFPVKVRNSFNTGVLLYDRKVHATYKMVEEYLCIFNLS